MAVKRRKYVEPAGYFNEAMRKADKEYDAEQKSKQKVAKKTSGKKK